MNAVLLALDVLQLLALAALLWGLWALLDNATLQPFAGRCGDVIDIDDLFGSAVCHLPAGHTGQHNGPHSALCGGESWWDQ